MLTLKNRTCVFAGGSGAIGEGAVKALSAAGMNVVLVTHSPARAQALVDACSAYPGRVMACSNEGGDCVAYIASKESAHTTGHVFNLTGGIHIG